MTARDLASIAFRFVGLLLFVRWLATVPFFVSFYRSRPAVGLGLAEIAAPLLVLALATALVLGGGRLAAALLGSTAQREVELGDGTALLTVGIATVGLWFALHWLGRAGGAVLGAMLNDLDLPADLRREQWLDAGWSATCCAAAVMLTLRAGRLAAWWDARRHGGEASSGGAA